MVLRCLRDVNTAMADELVLVAEDSEEIRRFVEESILGPAGFRVTAVGDGMSALTLAGSCCPTSS